MHLPGVTLQGNQLEDMVYEAQRKVILDIGRKRALCDYWKKCRLYPERPGRCVECIYSWRYAGKNTAYQLSLYNVDEKEAVKMMADTDKRRMTNYSFYTDQKWGKASNYTLCLNSSQLGYDRCEKIIMECSK